MSKQTKVRLHKERALSNKRNFQAKNIVSETTITCNEQTYGEDIYIGMAETTLKKAYSNHKRYFNLAVYENDTKLLEKKL